MDIEAYMLDKFLYLGKSLVEVRTDNFPTVLADTAPLVEHAPLCSHFQCPVTEVHHCQKSNLRYFGQTLRIGKFIRASLIEDHVPCSRGPALPREHALPLDLLILSSYVTVIAERNSGCNLRRAIGYCSIAGAITKS